jgi:hypothetical protein
MDPFDEVTSRSQQPGLLRRIRIRISILEVMLLVAVVAVSLRWPGLSVPVGLLSLYALARRKDILSRPTRVAFGQVALVLYLPPPLGLFLFPLEEWGHYLVHLSCMWTVYPWAGIAAVLEWWFQAHSLLVTLATVLLAALVTLAVIWGPALVSQRGLNWRIATFRLAAVIFSLAAMIAAFRLAPREFGSPDHPLANVVVSATFAVSLIVMLGMMARSGLAWRIACLVLVAVMSAGSTFFNWFVIHLPT